MCREHLRIAHAWQIVQVHEPVAAKPPLACAQLGRRHGQRDTCRHMCLCCLELRELKQRIARRLLVEKLLAHRPAERLQLRQQSLRLPILSRRIGRAHGLTARRKIMHHNTASTHNLPNIIIFANKCDFPTYHEQGFLLPNCWRCIII